MPETPDFESIALDCCGLLSISSDPLVESGRVLLVSRVAEQLRLAWNARGAADLAAIGVQLPDTFGAFAEIRKLDR